MTESQDIRIDSIKINTILLKKYLCKRIVATNLVSDTFLGTIPFIEMVKFQIIMPI